ncbi:ribosome assembly cofactor RimP [Rothia sp. SD9660Na]|uniref:ribosome maturation factor RimP n=1 Tax=Rothia sp. SD9660Na TaxID=3047030 RepID=UPI0024B93168|nr:ribosome assembly cofactor RimP [Rothia sp. SD9660Na]WHS49914.1 ribosome assembly cofactor RimP [Rothia sp. SD9660Na]
MASPKASKKDAPNARERRAAARAEQGITKKAPAGSFVSVEGVREAVTRVVEQEFKLVLEKLAAKGRGANRTLEIVVDYPEDRTDALSLDTIAEVSQALSAALDDADDGEVPYSLEVSSRGVTSPLIETRHWKRSIDRLIEITEAGGEKYLARLDFVTDEGPVVRRKKETKKGQPESYRDPVTLPWGTISAAKVEIEFNR